MVGISKEIFKKIRNIEMHTTQLANDLLAGAWHSAFKGQGMEFEEVREYQTGDDIRSIDWNVSARMNHPYVKVFSEERELTVLLVVDVSASSRYGSNNQMKRDLIAEIGAALAFSAIKNNDNVGLILFSEEIEKYIPPKKGSRHVLRVIREVLAFEPKSRGTNLLNALHFVGNIQNRSSICFLISDFICPHHPKEMSLISKKHDLISIAVTDPSELQLPNMELVELRDLETGETRLIDTSNKSEMVDFKKHSEQRLKSFEKLMKKTGAGFIDIRTNKPYLPAIRKFFKQREIKH